MFKRFAISACVVVGAILSVPCLGQEKAKAPIVTDPIYTAPQQLVDIGAGRRLNLYCRGIGTPTVIFDAGLGDSTISWALVQPAISRKTRTCSYDRAGLGFSDAATRPGTVNNMVDDLHALLQAAHIQPPYILVGHSAAGMTVRVFADHYRNQVVGMVIVDGSHEDQSLRSWAIEAPGSKALWDASLKDTTCIDAAKVGSINKGAPAYVKCVGDDDPRYSKAINEAMLTYSASLKWQAAAASEKQNIFYASADQTRATRKDFGDMPIIVMTHSPFPKNKNWTQERQDQHTLLWEDMHTQVAGMSTHGVNEIVPRSGHYIQYDRPEIVIDAIDQVMAIAKDQSQQSLLTTHH